MGVMNFLHAERATLPDNFRSEIDFVTRRTNTRAELHDHVCGIGAEALNHLRNRARDNAELGAFTPGMHQTDSRRFWIDNVNGATIGDVNAERDTESIRNDAVTTGEFFVTFHWCIPNRDFVPVNLFGGKQRPIAESSGIANALMGFFKPRQCFRFIVRDVDPRDPLRKNVTTVRQLCQGSELFNRQWLH